MNSKQWNALIVCAAIVTICVVASSVVEVATTLLPPAEEAVPRAYQCDVYTEQGCAKFVIASGGEIEIQSGGTFDLQSGATTDFSGGMDLDGALLDIDADGNTSLQADTDDQIDIEIGGADDFQFTANTFTALSGSTIAANTIAETTSGNGVVVDGLRIRDSGIAANVAITGTASVGGDITFANGTTLGEAVDTVLDLSEFLAFTEQTAVVVGVQTSITPTGTYQPITSGAAVSTSLTTAILDGTVNGQLLVLVNENAADAIIVVDGANTEMGGDKTLTGGQGDTLWLMWDGSDWLCIGYNDN